MRRVRLKHVADITAGQSPESAEVTHTAEGLPFLQGCAEFSAKFPITEKYCLNPPKIAQKGSWLISVRAPVGKLNLADQEYCIGRGLAAVHPNGVHHGYLGYVLLDQGGFFKRISTGSTFEAISTFQLMNLEIALPPLDTQCRIARFLDEKVARIDGLIEKKHELLNRLAEKRKALITRTVTKGLNPDAPLEPSEIGAQKVYHQATVGAGSMRPSTGALRYFGRIRNGSTPASGETEYWDGDVLWATPEDLGKLSGDCISQTKRRVTDSAVEESNLSVVPAGSVIVSTRAPIGHMAINNVPMAFNQGCRGIIPGDRVHGPFLYYTLKSRVPELKAVANGTTFVELSRDELAMLRIELPPLDMQRRIAQFLDEKTTQIDVLIQRIKDSIARLEEYRSTQITAAITGQLAELR